MKIKKLINEDYIGPSLLIISGKLDIKNKLLNGFNNKDLDYSTLFKDLVKEFNSYPSLHWNSSDESIYAVNKFVCPSTISKEDMEYIGKICLEKWGDTVINDVELKGIKDEEFYANLVPIDPPAGNLWLGDLFQTPEDQLRYEEFITDPFVFKRLKAYCLKKKLNIPEDVETSAGLPIHKKDSFTGELVINADLINYFEQYNFAKNYLNFEKDSNEYVLGKMMLIVPNFCEFIFEKAKLISKSGREENESSTLNTQKEITKAIKMIEKSKKLFTYFTDFEKYYN